MIVLGILGCFPVAEAIIDRTYYHILNLNVTATDSQIRQSYRAMSKKYHPDRVKNIDHQAAQHKFQQINVAYEALIQPESRAKYDKMGPAYTDQNRAQFMNRIPKDPSFRLSETVTLKQKFAQEKVHFKVKKHSACPYCNGTGAQSEKHYVQCNQCSGRGFVQRKQVFNNGFYNMVRDICPRCQGKGRKASRVCKHCKGSKILSNQDKYYSIDLKKTMGKTHEIVIPNLGDQRSNTVPGDGILTLNQKADPNFHRSGNIDLLTNLQITLEQALLGFQKEITHLDGRKIVVQKEEVSQPDEIVRILGEGMADKEDRGDLLIKLKVQLPLIDENKAQQLLKELGI